MKRQDGGKGCEKKAHKKTKTKLSFTFIILLLSAAIRMFVLIYIVLDFVFRREVDGLKFSKAKSEQIEGSFRLNETKNQCIEHLKRAEMVEMMMQSSCLQGRIHGNDVVIKELCFKFI